MSDERYLLLMRRACLSLVLVSLASLPCFGQVNNRRRNLGGAATRSVLMAQRAFVRAAREGDRRALRDVVSEDFVQTAASAKIADKAAMIMDTAANPGI